LVLRTLCEEHIRREPRDRQRELALFSARALYAAQNDVKFSRTHARKVFAQPFSKGWWGVGQRPTYGGVWGNAPHKQTNKSKFEKRKGGFSEIPFELYTLFKIFSRMAKKIYNYFLQKLNFVYCNTIIIMI